MSYKTNYPAPAAQQLTTTWGSKPVLMKSFKIDISGATSPFSGFLTATAYTLGYLPKDAQVIGGNVVVATSVSGGTVSAATLAVAIGGQSFFAAANVFATGIPIPNNIGYYLSGLSPTTDQVITYTPTLTGAGATAGILYINLMYVV